MRGEVPGEGRAWVKDEGERNRRELELQQHLVGRMIKHVRYTEARYGGWFGPMWSRATWDALDYGLELDLDDEKTWSVIWKQQGHNEALLVYEGQLRGSELLADAGVIWDVTEHWSAVGPHSISSVTSVWTRHGFGPALNSTGQQVAAAGQSDLCLITLILAADDGREAVITLGDIGTDGSYTYSAENVVVFFSVAEARKAEVLLPGDPEAA